MKKYLLPAAVALAGGAVGFGLRKWQLAAGFEPDTGLAIPGAPAALTLIVWSALAAAVLLALCVGCKTPAALDPALDARGNSLFLTAAVLSAFLLLAGGGLDLAAWWTARQAALPSGTLSMLSTVLPLLRAILCLLGCPCALLWARQLAREPEKARESLPLLELCLLLCVWLISDYQVRASDPVILNYVYEVLAIVCALLALYYLAGYSFQTGKPRRTVLFCLLGACFSLVTLADGHDLADVCRYGALVLFLTAHAALLLAHQEAGSHLAKEETEGKSDE